MKITVNEMYELLKSLPDPNNTYHDQWVAVFYSSEIEIKKHTDMYPSEIHNENEIIFRRIRTYRGYEWVMNI